MTLPPPARALCISRQHQPTAAVTALPSLGEARDADLGLAFFGMIRLAQLVGELQDAQDQHAELAVAAERLKATGELQSAVGERLDGIAVMAQPRGRPWPATQARRGPSYGCGVLGQASGGAGPRDRRRPPGPAPGAACRTAAGRRGHRSAAGVGRPGRGAVRVCLRRVHRRGGRQLRPAAYGVPDSRRCGACCCSCITRGQRVRAGGPGHGR
jgi:hypothetical protein